MFLFFAQVASAEEVLDQQSINMSGLGQQPSDAVEYAQSFTVGVSGTLSRVEVYILKILNVIQDLTVTIYDANSGVPTTALGSATLFSSTITGTAAFRSVDVSGLAIDVTAGDKLAFGLRKNPDSGIHIMPFDNADPYAGGNAFSRNLGPPIAAWQTQSTWDFGFKTYVLTEDMGGLLGDYNDDGTIDAVDYTVWRNTLDSGGSLLNDATPEDVTIDDYDYWKAHYGDSTPGAGGVSFVPEPGTATLFGLSLCLCVGWLSASRRKP
jgi:hypothetical protein